MKRTFSYQYRLAWRYRGEKQNRYYVSDNPAAVLRMLHRVGTARPELGVTPTQFKRSWAWLARRYGVGFAAIADVPPADILVKLQESFPKLEFIRVEQRQVAAWTEMLDPIKNIRSLRPKVLDKEAERTRFYDRVCGMTRAELDAWRWIPDEAAQKVRTRGDK